MTETGNAYLLKDRNGLPLDSGLPSNGDGTWAVLGFFDNGTVGDAFNGNWVALTEGTTVGDSSSGYGYDDGMFSFTTVFSKDSNQVSVYPNEPAGYSVNAPFTILDNVPTPGQPLCIRFYDRATKDASSRYNTVTDPNWVWPTFSSGIPSNLYLKAAPGSAPAGSAWIYGSTFEDSTSPFQSSLRIKARLQASVFGLGGSVSLNPNNGDGLYDYDSNVTLTAVADPHFEFVRWNGPGVAQPTSQVSTIQMSGDRNVTATFQVRQYNVTITKTGQGTFTGAGVYPYDSNVSVTASASSGYQFSHWQNYDSLGNPTTGLDNNLSSSATLNVNGGHALVAVFNPISYNISVTSTQGGSGQVVQPGPYPFDGNYTLSASANSGYSFSGWTGDANSVGLLRSTTDTISPFLLTHPGNLSYTANFSENQYLLTVLYGSGGASASPSSPTTHKHFDMVPITASALHGYEFDRWEDANGSLVDFTQLSTDVNMSHSGGDVMVRALFKPRQYSVNLTAGPGGQVTINPTAGPWEHFSVYPVWATPATGYAFSGWSGDANSTNSLTKGTSDGNNSVAVVGPVTLDANFSLIDFNVTATVATGGGSVSGSGSYTINDTPQLVAVASPGWNFTNWTGDTFALTSSNSLSSTINLLQFPQNLTLQANFARNSYDLNVTTDGNGLVNGQTNLTLSPSFQDLVELNATASSGWEFNRWYGYAFPNPNNSSVSFNINSDMDLNASFQRKSFLLDISAANHGQSSGEGTYAFESNVTVSTLPNTGYQFNQWTGDVQYLSDPNSSSTVVTIPDRNISITPTFSPKTFFVTVTSDLNGSVTGAGSYSFGSTATLTPTGNGPDLNSLAGYEFSKWSITNPFGQVSESSNNPLPLLVDGNYSVSASFTPVQINVHDLNLSVSPAGSGMLFDDPSQRVWNLGASTLSSVIKATPNPGYSFVGWRNPDGKTITPGFRSPVITFVTDSNASLIAEFKKNVVDAVARVSGNGTTQVESNATALSLQASPGTGHSFQNWTLENNFTYNVTLGNSSVNPANQVFYLNGKESPSLTLLKGYTYTFACSTGSDAFYLSTQVNSSGFSAEYTDSNLTGSRATVGNLTFTIPNNFDTNTTLYYCSSQTAFLGNSIQVIDPILESAILPFPTQPQISPAVSHDLSLQANFIINQYAVTIEAGTGGTLNSGSSGTYAHGTSVNLAATPSAHYTFSHWEGATFASPSSLSTSTTITAPTTVRAVFSPVPYTLTLSKNIDTAGDVFTTSNVYQFHYNDTVAIQAQARSGYGFVSWSNGMTNPTEQVTILGNTTLTANFDGEPASLTQLVQTYDSDDTLLNGISGGFVVASSNPPYKFGDVLQLTPTDEPGFQFDGWLDGNGTLLSSSRSFQLSLVSSQTVVAKFKKRSYEVKIFTAPLVGGTIKADRGTNSQIQTLFIPHGAKVNLQALANAEYQFEKWVGDGLQSADIFSSQLELTVTQDLSLTGRFIPLQPINLTIAIVPAEAGFAIGDGSFIYNAKHPIFATPSVGYIFEEWEGVGIEDLKSATTSILLNENKTVKAKFIKDPNYNGPDGPTAPGLHSLQLISSPTAGGNTVGSGIFGTGWNDISAVRNPGYVFSHWVADGVESPNSANTRIFLAKNIQVTASFRLVTGADLIGGSVQLGNSWWYSDWFGPFWHRDGELWVYHSVLGWIFMDPQKEDLSVWLWVDYLNGWQWTTASIWTSKGGFLHSNTSATWHWFNKGVSTAQSRLFYRYDDMAGNGSWLQF